jgi:predicted AAA+ superfamily ATPase
MKARWLSETIEKHLQHSPAVALLGPRQVGKTTLAKEISRSRASIYLDLESPEDQLKLNDPVAFLSLHRDRLVVLDEIQRAPDLFATLRGIIDTNREEGRPNGQFLLLGSASADLLRQSSESLAGRIRYLEMSGFNLLELEVGLENRNTLWLRGGFPQSYLAVDDGLAMDWLEDLIRTYLERDVAQMGFRVPAVRLRRLWTMLAHLQGEPVNYSKIGANLEMDNKSVSHYIEILTDLLLVRRLDPWHANVKKRLIKSPRFYVRDSGLQHRLLGIENHDALLSNPVLGKSWEGFVIENIHSVLPRRAESYFYRTAAGAEIDLVVKMPSSETWAIEIKHGTAPKVGKHYSETCDDVGAARKYIVYGGDDAFPLGRGVTMISLRKLMQLITA